VTITVLPVDDAEAGVWGTALEVSHLFGDIDAEDAQQAFARITF
jgi:hypothetical protein